MTPTPSSLREPLEREVLKIFQDNGVTGPGRLESLNPITRARIAKCADRLAGLLQSLGDSPDSGARDSMPLGDGEFVAEMMKAEIFSLRAKVETLEAQVEGLRVGKDVAVNEALEARAKVRTLEAPPLEEGKGVNRGG